MGVEEPVLASVACSVVRAAPALAPLSHVTDLISALLDVSVLVSVQKAAASASPRLFARVLRRHRHDDAVRSFWCARALDRAVRRNDLAMVQMIHRLHPEPLVVRSLDAGLTYGRLELVQWIVTHRNDRLCCDPGIQNLCRSCVLNGLRWIGDQDALHVVQWLHEEGVLDIRSICGPEWLPFMGALRQSVELVEWCLSLGVLRGRLVDMVVESSLALANRQTRAIVSRLLDRTTTYHGDKLLETLIIASLKHNAEEVVEMLLSHKRSRAFRQRVKYATFGDGDTKVLQWDHKFLRSTRLNGLSMTAFIARKAESHGHVATSKWVRESCGMTMVNPRRASVDTSHRDANVSKSLRAAGMLNCVWRCVEVAVSSDNLAFVQWLHAKSIPGLSERMMVMATRSGCGDIVLWLFDNRRTSDDVNPSAYYGDLYLEIVQWLVENHAELHVELTMIQAAVCGHVDVLTWLAAQMPDACTACVRDEIVHEAQYFELGEWNGAPVLHALEWLDAHRVQRESCEGQCCGPRESWYPNGRTTSFAVQTGDLQLLQYLQRHHGDRLERDLQEQRVTRAIVEPGHTGVANWIHANFHDLIDWDGVHAAAKAVGSHHIAEWVSTAEYRETETRDSYLRRAAHWLGMVR